MQKFSKPSENITSLELVKQINLIREREGNRTELRHDNLLAIIRDEFEEEIGLLNILETSYIHPQNGQTYPMFTLTIAQGKQVLVRESRFVRKATIGYLEAMEEKVQSLQPKLPQNYIGALKALIISEKKNEKLLKLRNIDIAKIEFIERILDTGKKLDIGQCAKILELPFGKNILYKNLCEQGIFFKGKNEPKQDYVERGYFQLKEKWIENKKTDESFMVLKILVTKRGLVFLRTLFKSEPKSKINVQIN